MLVHGRLQFLELLDLQLCWPPAVLSSCAAAVIALGQLGASSSSSSAAHRDQLHTLPSSAGDSCPTSCVSTCHTRGVQGTGVMLGQHAQRRGGRATHEAEGNCTVARARQERRMPAVKCPPMPFRNEATRLRPGAMGVRCCRQTQKPSSQCQGRSCGCRWRPGGRLLSPALAARLDPTPAAGRAQRQDNRSLGGEEMIARPCADAAVSWFLRWGTAAVKASKVQAQKKEA